MAEDSTITSAAAASKTTAAAPTPKSTPDSAAPVDTERAAVGTPVEFSTEADLAADTDAAAERLAKASLGQAVDSTIAGPGADVAVVTSAAGWPTADVVAMVSRDANGDPAQTKNFVVLVAPDADEATRDAHWNVAGAAQGARYVDPANVPAAGILPDPDVQARELARINYSPADHATGGRHEA